MRSLNLLQWAGALALAFSLSPGSVVAQDTLSITGTFKMNGMTGTVGADLASVQPNAADRWWKLTLNGVSYSHHYDFADDGHSGVSEEWFITRVHATSFTVEFFGPGAAILNEVVSSQLTWGGQTDGAFLDLVNYSWYDAGSNPVGLCALRLLPTDPPTGVHFQLFAETVPEFPSDELGYPLVQPQRLTGANSSIDDFRPGNGGSLRSYDDVVDIGSDQQPIPPLQIAVADASVSEGNRGTKTLLMTVRLNHASEQGVTVNYQTADGTALVSNRDYVRTSGTLTFQPGETSKTISISITGDRKREPNETFTVQLSNAVGATISDGVGTATIVNDD
jgi:hypothetical protein